jgi:hypothetical protein
MVFCPTNLVKEIESEENPLDFSSIQTHAFKYKRCMLSFSIYQFSALAEPKLNLIYFFQKSVIP